MKLLSFVVVVSICASTLGKTGFGTTEQEWGFVEVRDGAHMFWWLHQTSANVSKYTDRPVVIWLQGGPGASSTGYGNLAELGPLDVDLNERNTTWLKDVNVLFIDNPVGTGYSYVDSPTNLATNNRAIADDFLVLMKGIYEELPELKTTPLYIFCESYGGKMTAEIALVLDQAIKAGEWEADFRGVGLGDSWISPIDSVLTWAPYLLNLGLVDQNGYEEIQEAAERTKDLLDKQDYVGATDEWGQTEYVVLLNADNVDFYNVLTKIPTFGKASLKNRMVKPLASRDDNAKIDELMNNDVKKALGLDQDWNSNGVFAALGGDFMKPVTEIVELLLNTTDLKVAVYNGQLDLIVDTPGTIKWVDALQFSGSSDWQKASRQPVVVNGIIEGERKTSGQLSFYWVHRAGHMVPIDNAEAMRYILDDVTDGFTTERKSTQGNTRN